MGRNTGAVVELDGHRAGAEEKVFPGSVIVYDPGEFQEPPKPTCLQNNL